MTLAVEVGCRRFLLAYLWLRRFLALRGMTLAVAMRLRQDYYDLLPAADSAAGFVNERPSGC